MTTPTQDDLHAALEAAGFTHNDAAVGTKQSEADAAGMSDNGPYRVFHVWERGTTTIHVESTNAPLDMGGLEAQVQYPTVCIIDSVKGRIACSPNDVELVLQLAEELN